MPWKKRVLIATPMMLVLGWIVMALTASIWITTVELALMETGEIEVDHEDTFFDFSGHFGATDVTLVRFLPDGNEVTYKIDKVTFTTPGFLWMLRQSWIKEDEELPDVFGIELTNARNIADASETPGNYTNLPYDAMGCTADLLSPSDLRAMGVPSARTIGLHMKRFDDSQSDIRFTMRTPGAGEMEMGMRIGLQRPVKYDKIAEVLPFAPLKSMNVKFTDLGFVAKRRDYCGQKHGKAGDAFIAYHMQEVARRLATVEHLAYPPSVMAQYREFADQGGTLELRASAVRKMTIIQFFTLDRVQEMQAFPSVLAVNGKPAVPFSVSFNVNAAPMPAAAPAPVVAMPVSMVQAAPVQAAVPAGALPAPGAVVPLSALGALTGQHIDVATKFGSVRKGVVTLVGPLAINVQLDKEEGGLLLTMPTDSITSITYTPLAPPASAQQAKAP